MAFHTTFSTSKLRISVPIILILLLLQTLHATSSSARRNLLRSAPQSRRNNNQIPNCIHLVSESQCSHNPKCRWCRSQSLDDTCFTKSEAWRLPLQVFSCDQWSRSLNFWSSLFGPNFCLFVCLFWSWKWNFDEFLYLLMLLREWQDCFILYMLCFWFVRESENVIKLTKGIN